MYKLQGSYIFRGNIVTLIGIDKGRIYPNDGFYWKFRIEYPSGKRTEINDSSLLKELK